MRARASRWVASEVKNLANQTAKATEEIAAHIGSVQTSTKEAVTAIEAITGTIGEVDEISSTIAAAVEEQSAATQEIARNVEEASNGAGEVSRTIVGVNQAANDTGVAAHQIKDASGELSQQSERLRAEVATFLDNIPRRLEPGDPTKREAAGPVIDEPGRPFPGRSVEFFRKRIRFETFNTVV